MDHCGADLYWIPVAAGTSRAQQASLRFWEAFEAARARRPRATLYHSALKLHLDGETSTLELTPAFIDAPVPPLATGPVGLRAAGRLRLFRYQLLLLPADHLPDEDFAVGDPIRLADDCDTVRRILELAPSIPRYVWGRRLRGTKEMWTSDSVVSWLLMRAGLDLSGIGPPPGGRAPGWFVGSEIASRTRRAKAG